MKPTKVTQGKRLSPQTLCNLKVIITQRGVKIYSGKEEKKECGDCVKFIMGCFKQKEERQEERIKVDLVGFGE